MRSRGLAGARLVAVSAVLGLAFILPTRIVSQGRDEITLPVVGREATPTTVRVAATPAPRRQRRLAHPPAAALLAGIVRRVQPEPVVARPARRSARPVPAPPAPVRTTTSAPSEPAAPAVSAQPARELAGAVATGPGGGHRQGHGRGRRHDSERRHDDETARQPTAAASPAQVATRSAAPAAPPGPVPGADQDAHGDGDQERGDGRGHGSEGGRRGGGAIDE